MAEALTAAERRILETPDAELERTTRVFSFDLEKVAPRVHSVDRWQAALQAHLYLDHILTRMLEEALVRPGSIKLKRMSFVQRLDLVEAMGLLGPPIARPVRVLNGLRNHIAHQLDGQILDQQVLDLANAFPKGVRDAIRGKEVAPAELTFGELLFALVLQVDIVRQKAAYHRLVGQKAVYDLRDALVTAADRRGGVIRSS